MVWLLYCSVFLITGASAALPACNSGVISPPGGIWTEWVTTSSCSSTCGACSKLFYTRKCLSARAGYPCTGDATKFTACNIQTCIYPAQRTCCIPAVPMLINGSMQCGPLPKESSSTVSCCPSGGLWTQWSDFVKDASTVKYTRTRECASTEAGCPCDPKLGYEEKTECPCPKVLIAAKSCNSGSGVVPRLHRALIIDDEKCTAYLKVEASNDHYEGTKKIVYCAGVVGLNFVPALRFLAEDGTTCITDRPFDCETRPEPRTNGTLPVTFTCDLEKQLWRYDYGGWLITGYIQMSWD